MGAKVVVDYEKLEKEKELVIQRQISQKLANQTAGKIDSLKHAVLVAVANSEYEKALRDLDRYIESKAGYPSFAPRTDAFARHCRELINAIQVKRTLPGLASLTVSRQQEMLDHVVAHFEELKGTVKQIERIAKDCALDDLRSTVWVVRTVSYVAIAVFASAFMMDFSNSLGRPFILIYNDFTDRLWNLISSFI